MRDPILVLFGGFLLLVALALGAAVIRTNSRRIGKAATGIRRRGQLAVCVTLAAAGLDIAVVNGIGTSTSAGTGITVELGFAMMLLAVVWFLFRREVVRYQLRIATAVYGLATPAEPAQVKAAETVGTFIRHLLFVAGLFIVLAKIVLR